MQKYLRELKPDKFGDLIAMNALYRPGLVIAYIPEYIDRKHGRSAKYNMTCRKWSTWKKHMASPFTRNR